MNKAPMYARAIISSSLFALVCSSALAANGPPPPAVSQPGGINLGNTSFYDGFAGPPGLNHNIYLQHSRATSFRDNDGNDNKVFDNPEFSATTLVNQFTYYSPKTIGRGGHLGWSIILPIVSLDADFGAKGPQLKDNGTGFGDISLGPMVQFDPIVDAQGRPTFVQRLALDVSLPIGEYDETKDFNPGSNFYSINPYWAATWMPAERWEMSWRLHYLYNFKNSDPASSTYQLFNGDPVRDTQAGQAAWSNFAASYEVIPNVSVGLNGYYFKQLEDDKVNGQRLEDSREEVLGIGPGLLWKNTKGPWLWFNVYHETEVENRAKNDFSVQARLAYPF